VKKEEKKEDVIALDIAISKAMTLDGIKQWHLYNHAAVSPSTN
jgi:hypothetical protein